MRLVRWAPVAAIGAAVLGTACSGAANKMGPPGPPTQFVKIAGDGQSWYFNNPLPAPYTVRALDANNRGVPGVMVTWAVTAGSGSVTPKVETTDANGTAGAVHALDAGTATQTVTATPAVTGLPVLTFTANALAPPTVDTVTVNNNFFSPKTVAIQVNHPVTWTWSSGGVEHTVTFTAGPTPLPTEAAQSTGSHSTTFTTVGTYSYVCTIHAGMSGTVSVVN
jgi:plastocyanin